MRYLKIAAYVCLSLPLFGSAAFGQQPLDITWTNGSLTAHLSDAPLSDVVKNVAQLAGIEVIGLDKLSGKLSVDFANLAPEPALSKILANVNYVMQEIVGADANAPRQLVLRVHSMVDGSAAPLALSGPIQVPALEALFVEEIQDLADEKEVEAEEAAEDDDSFNESRAEKLEAARLAAEGAFDPKADVKPLLKLVENYYNDEVRLEALKALGARSLEVALRPALKALGDDSWEVRMAAVEILGRAKDPESLRTVGQLLEKNPDKDVRIGALRVLALRADPDSADYLRAVLKDAEPVIRAAAEQLLAEINRRAEAKRQSAR